MTYLRAQGNSQGDRKAKGLKVVWCMLCCCLKSHAHVPDKRRSELLIWIRDNAEVDTRARVDGEAGYKAQSISQGIRLRWYARHQLPLARKASSVARMQAKVDRCEAPSIACMQDTKNLLLLLRTDLMPSSKGQSARQTGISPSSVFWTL